MVKGPTRSANDFQDASIAEKGHPYAGTISHYIAHLKYAEVQYHFICISYKMGADVCINFDCAKRFGQRTTSVFCREM